jgi:hypothetical protein
VKSGKPTANSYRCEQTADEQSNQSIHSNFELRSAQLGLIDQAEAHAHAKRCTIDWPRMYQMARLNERTLKLKRTQT